MIQKRWKNDQGGFTLMEMMIVLSIISILVTPFIYLEIFYTERYRSTMAYQDMAEAGNRTLDWIARDFRASRGVLETWRQKKLAKDRLILQQRDDLVVIYAFDKKKKTITREEHHARGDGDYSAVLTLAEWVDQFEIDPVNPSTPVLNLRVRLSRELIHSEDVVTMTGVASRRMK
ncbi:MAG: prepilin-type N-terminal cleavage/methylation domain-containing protein [Desulfobacterales bacterium]|nr:prepilin-type N-terminal cleavage/methylation domain-containing protein [Desulfobacterales bacterium]